MTPEKIAELKKIHDDLWFPADPFTGWFSDQNMGQRAHEIKCAVCTIRNALPDLLSLAERAVEAEKLAASGKDSLNLTYGMLLSARQAREVAESRVQALEAELRVAREALGKVDYWTHPNVTGFPENGDNARERHLITKIGSIARETLAKIGGGNE